MRRVVGKGVVELSGAQLERLRADYETVLIDVGTGDGKHALATARANPATLVIGVDASPDAMRRASARAAARPARGGLPNALFLWAAAEDLPSDLDGVAGEIHVLMPWGSLLRGVLAPDQAILGNLARVAAPRASLLVTLNLHAWRPAVPEVTGIAEPRPDSVMSGLAVTYQRAGWRMSGGRYLSPAEVDAMATSWTRRLGSSRDHIDVLALTATRAG
jgi:16S rRNA (adenine(1408)-N(1))-methyltransferase